MPKVGIVLWGFGAVFDICGGTGDDMAVTEDVAAGIYDACDFDVCDSDGG